MADNPIRCGGRLAISSSRSIDSERWAPRLVGASAWISSMITVSTDAKVSAADDVSIRYKLSGVVISRSGGVRINFCRSRDAVSPVRIATVGTKIASPALGRERDPASGARRFFSTSKAKARIGEMYSTRVRDFLSSGGGDDTNRSIEVRKAARVLPLPVGAQISV